MPIDLCLLTTPAAGNWSSLAGTLLLGYAGLRVLPAARQMHKIIQAQTQLDLLKRQTAPPKDGSAPAEQDRFKAFDSQVAAGIKSGDDMLQASQRALAGQRDRLTRWDMVVAVVGVLLTAGSDLLPLLGDFCLPPAPAPGGVP